MTLLAIAIVVLNFIGPIRFGLKLDRPVLTPLGYIVLLIVTFKINGYAGMIVLIICAIATIVSFIVDAAMDSVPHDRESEKKKVAEQKNKSLIEAVEKEDVYQTRHLIENGADVNSSNLLYKAVTKNNKELVSLLLEKGAAVNFTYGEKTPLDVATDKEIITILKNNGAHTKVEVDEISRQNYQKARQQYAINEGLIDAVMKHNFDIIEDYLSRGADINYESGTTETFNDIHISTPGMTPLLAAISKNDLDMVKILVSKGADVKYVPLYVPPLVSSKMDAVAFARAAAINGEIDSEIADFLERYSYL